MGLALATAAAVLTSSCGVVGSGSDDPPLCAPEAQSQVFEERVGEQPSSPFTIPALGVSYVMVTVRAPTDSGLFAGLGGVATLRVITAGALPNISTDSDGHELSSDPKVDLKKARRWERLKLRPGVYRFYSLAGSPTVAVMTCPADR
jgi:hypothetical protein